MTAARNLCYKSVEKIFKLLHIYIEISARLHFPCIIAVMCVCYILMCSSSFAYWSLYLLFIYVHIFCKQINQLLNVLKHWSKKHEINHKLLTLNDLIYSQPSVISLVVWGCWFVTEAGFSKCQNAGIVQPTLVCVHVRLNQSLLLFALVWTDDKVHILNTPMSNSRV